MARGLEFAPIAVYASLSYVEGIGEGKLTMVTKFSTLAAMSFSVIFAQSASAEISEDQFRRIIATTQGTLSVRNQPLMLDGKLAGCSLVFDALAPDWTYHDGAPLKVNGNVAVLVNDKTVASSLKVVVHEVRLDAGQMVFDPSPPSRAYLISPKFKTNMDSRLHADGVSTPGGLFSVFDMSPTLEMLFDYTESGVMRIAFNQDRGSTDIILDIDLHVEDKKDDGTTVKSNKATSEFMDCLAGLTNKPEKKSRLQTGN